MSENINRIYKTKFRGTTGTSRPVQSGGVRVLSNVLSNTNQTSLTDDINIPFDSTIHVQVDAVVDVTISSGNWSDIQYLIMEILDGASVIRSKTASFMRVGNGANRAYTFPINSITTLGSGDYRLRWRFIDEHGSAIASNYEVSYVLVLKASDDKELMGL